MAINKNHEFEELEGVKCGIVERLVTPARLEFIRPILEFNGYTVVAVPSPPPKTTAPVQTVEENIDPAPLAAPQTFTVGVTDYTFNTINAIFGRALKTKEGKVITLAYWKQEETVSNDEVPYFRKG
jgi:hypothetical protein